MPPPSDHDHADLVDELKRLRGSKGILDAAKVSRFPALVRLCGEGDPLDAYVVLRAELKRWAQGRRNEAAYAWSVIDKSDSVLGRLDAAVMRVPGAAGADQRTIRRWGDDAIPGLATELLILAETAGRRGRTMISIESRGNPVAGLHVVIDVLNPVDLAPEPPLIHVWRFDPSGDPVETNRILDTAAGTEVLGEEYVMTRYNLLLPSVQLPAASSHDDRLLQVDIHLQDAPTVSSRFRDCTAGDQGLSVEFMAFRSSCQITINRDDSDGVIGH